MCSTVIQYFCRLYSIITPLYFSSVQSFSHIQLFATPWIAAHQASLSITNSRSLLKLISIKSVMASNHLIPCCPLLLSSIFPSIRVFSNKLALRIRWPKYGASASASVLPINIWGWFSLGWTGLISLQSKGLSGVFSSMLFPKETYSGVTAFTSLL